MRTRLLKRILLVAAMLSILPAVLVNGAQDQSYAGTWNGSYSSESGATGNLSYVFSKDAKGQWQGTVKFNNQDGEQKGQFKSLKFAAGKMTAKMDSPDGKAEVTIEGTRKGNRLDGSYSVAGADGLIEKGTWTVTRAQ